MVIGLLLRHFKIYRNLQFIPIANNAIHRFSVFIGNNGAGKSSILESLNTFFNDGYWNKSKDENKDDAFIAPVFLIKKEKIEHRFKGRELLIFQFISDYFWEANDSIGPALKTNEAIQNFLSFRDYLRDKLSLRNQYLLFVIGQRFDEKNKVYFSSFDQDLKKELNKKFPDFIPDKLIGLMKSMYAYVYVPVESHLKDFLKIENLELQKLMSKDILFEIDNILKSNVFDKNGSKTNIVSYLNSSLENFINEINSAVKKLDESYSFTVESGFKKNLTPLDLRDKIIEVFFSIRTLKKDKKEINELSSGEKRTALIDIASAFLMQQTEKEKEVIFGIDEPEASLHISNCFNQFKRIENLSKNGDQIQILVTTHWYGSLPTIQTGNLHYIEKSDSLPKITTFNFNNYLEQQRTFPNDVLLKSYFELITAIISILKSDEQNWIICEGKVDKIYLEFYLKSRVKKLHVLPVGGLGNVIKVYNYLFFPFYENIEKKLIKGKILCVIDSDENRININMSSDVDKKLKISRIEVDQDEAKASLVSISTNKGAGKYLETDIEDCLNSETLFHAIMEYVDESDNMALQDVFNKFEFNQGRKNSRIKGEKSLLKPKNIDALELKEVVYNELDKYEVKTIIAEKYVRISNEDNVKEIPDLFVEITNFFEN